MNWSTCCFLTPLLVSVSLHTSLSPHTQTCPQTVLDDLLIMLLFSQGITGLLTVKSGLHEGLVPFLGSYYLLPLMCVEAPPFFCFTSKWIMVLSLSLLLSRSVSLSVRPWPLVDSGLLQAHCHGLTAPCERVTYFGWCSWSGCEITEMPSHWVHWQ